VFSDSVETSETLQKSDSSEYNVLSSSNDDRLELGLRARRRGIVSAESWLRDN
jgi:hypothetical protein